MGLGMGWPGQPRIFRLWFPSRCGTHSASLLPHVGGVWSTGGHGRQALSGRVPGREEMDKEGFLLLNPHHPPLRVGDQRGVGGPRSTGREDRKAHPHAVEPAKNARLRFSKKVEARLCMASRLHPQGPGLDSVNRGGSVYACNSVTALSTPWQPSPPTKQTLRLGLGRNLSHGQGSY